MACAVRVHSKPSWHHVKAHDDHPWTEMAESSIKWAAKRNLCHLPTSLLPALQAGPGAAWEWFRVVDQATREAYPQCDGCRFTGAQMPMHEIRSLSLVFQCTDLGWNAVDSKWTDVLCWPDSSSVETLFLRVFRKRVAPWRCHSVGTSMSLRPRQLEVWVVVKCGSTQKIVSSRNPKFRRGVALWCTLTVGFLWSMSGQRGCNVLWLWRMLRLSPRL